jgi:hypothetical protein
MANPGAQIITVPARDSMAARFRRAMQIAEMVGNDQPVRAADKAWWLSYVQTAEYNGIYKVWEDFGDAALESLE